MFKSEAAKTALNAAVSFPWGILGALAANQVIADPPQILSEFNRSVLVNASPFLLGAMAAHAAQTLSALHPAKAMPDYMVRVNRRSLIIGTLAGVFMGSAAATAMLQSPTGEDISLAPKAKQEIILRHYF